MFRDIGLPELLIILVIVLLVFGAGKLPQIGGALGKSIREFKKEKDGIGEKPEEKATAQSSQAAGQAQSNEKPKT